jgi:hypothetical protein
MYVQALLINALIILLVPRILSKPVGFQALDDFVLYLKAQQAFLVYSSVMLALVIYATNYWLEYSNNADVMSPISSRVKV